MRKKIHWKRRAIVTGCMLLAAAFLSYGAVEEEPPEMLRSVTYVSDAWVKNFWNTESDHMEEELAQIAEDGFNSIILAVPWREFQPDTGVVRYNGYAFDKLDRVMEAAGEQGLWVILRVGYTWDQYGNEASQIRYRKLLREEKTRSAWLDYVETLYESVSGYENFYGGFLTWEDFWNYVEDAPILFISEHAKTEEAKKIGFQKYLEEHYTLEQVNGYFSPAKPFGSYSQVGIPGRDSPAYKLFYEYYDNFLMDLLAESQQVFPGLSMEVRLDVDPVEGLNGEKAGANHYQTFSCGNAPYTGLMYSVSMGQEFNREITAKEAVSMMEELLGQVKAHNGGKPVYIDQLLYMDMTPGFEHNARLLEAERNAFLAGISGILRQYTNGYAVWSYRNYAHNDVYNSQFALGNRGWDVRRVRFVEHNGSRQALLEGGGRLSQAVKGGSGDGRFRNHVRFTADSDSPVTLSVKLDSQVKDVVVDGQGRFDLDFGCSEYRQLCFMSDGDVYLDNICLYNFVQDGQLYDLDGNELSCLEGVRELNRMLTD